MLLLFFLVFARSPGQRSGAETVDLRVVDIGSHVIGGDSERHVADSRRANKFVRREHAESRHGFDRDDREEADYLVHKHHKNRDHNHNRQHTQAPPWRSAAARDSLIPRIKKLVAKSKRRGTDGVDSFPEVYGMRKSWLQKFPELKNEIPLHLIGVFFSAQRDGSPIQRDIPSYATHMDLGGLEKKLLDGGDANEADTWGRTAAHHAVLNADEAMLDMLIAKGAKLDQADKWGMTPRSLLSDPWRHNRSSAWSAMATRVGVEAAHGKKHKSSLDVADKSPIGWVERARLPWPKLMDNVQDVDVVAGDADRAEIHKEYFAKSKPFKTQGSFQRCPELLQKFSKDHLSESDLMWTTITPGRVPYGENGRPMGQESTMADYIAKRMGKEELLGPVGYGDVPFYLFSGIETFTRQHMPHNHTRSTGHKEKGKIKAKWYKLWKDIHRCMSKSVGWFKDFKHFDDGRWWTLGLGPGGSGAPHHAHAAAVNLAVVGHKLWHIYPPAVSNYTSDPVSLWQNRREAGSIVQPVSFLQHPGDLVFVPANWAHSTMCLGDTVSFSAVLPNSMAGSDIEPESVNCHLGRDGHCQYMDPNQLGKLALIDTGELKDPNRPFGERADGSVFEPPKTKPMRLSRSLKRRHRHRHHHTWN